MDDRHWIANTLAYVMRERNMTVANVARRAGVSHNTISNILLEEFSTTVTTLLKICNAVGLRIVLEDVGGDDAGFSYRQAQKKVSQVDGEIFRKVSPKKVSLRKVWSGKSFSRKKVSLGKKFLRKKFDAEKVSLGKKFLRKKFECGKSFSDKSFPEEKVSPPRIFPRKKPVRHKISRKEATLRMFAERAKLKSE